VRGGGGGRVGEKKARGANMRSQACLLSSAEDQMIVGINTRPSLLSLPPIASSSFTTTTRGHGVRGQAQPHQR